MDDRPQRTVAAGSRSDVIAIRGGGDQPCNEENTTMPVPTAPVTQLAQRRCWRCLQQFTTDPPVPVREDFWLCDPCAASLLPAKRRAS